MLPILKNNFLSEKNQSEYQQKERGPLHLLWDSAKHNQGMMMAENTPDVAVCFAWNLGWWAVDVSEGRVTTQGLKSSIQIPISFDSSIILQTSAPAAVT